jgi:hypothetical protein
MCDAAAWTGVATAGRNLTYAAGRSPTRRPRSAPVRCEDVATSSNTRRAPISRWLLPLVGVAAVAAIGAIAMPRFGGPAGGSASAVQPAPTTGTLSFVVEPGDATILIGGQSGSAERVVGPGRHEVEIRREGYQAWVATIDVVAGERQTVRVPLEPVVDLGVAQLTVDSTPPGLMVTIDGEAVGPTPLATMIAPGRHLVAIVRDGQPAWSQTVDAVADTQYRFDPVIDGDRRSRDDRRAEKLRTEILTRRVQAVTSQRSRGRDDDGDGGSDAEREGTPIIELGVTAAAPAPALAAAPESADLVPVQPASPVVARPAAAPRLVPAAAVTRTSGVLPELTADEQVAVDKVTIKVCIDERGRVTSSRVLTALPGGAGARLEEAIHDWRYQPYRDGGVAVPACFARSFPVAARAPAGRRGTL